MGLITAPFFVFWNIFILCLLAIAAKKDIEKKEIPDILTAWIWFIVALIILNGGEALSGIVVVSFALLFLVNAIMAVRYGPLFSWGDILIMPPLIGLISVNPLFILILGLFLIAGLGYAYKHGEEALTPYVFCGYLMFVAWLVFENLHSIIQ